MVFELSFELLSAGAALGMSIYNYWQARQPGLLVLGELVEVGAMLAFSPQTRQEHLLLFLPVQFFNEGSDTAMVTDLKMTTEGPEGSVPMFLTKRVQGRTSDEIESLQPIFPIFVKAGQAVVETFEFMDGAEVALKLDRSYEVTLTVTYDLTRTTSRTYTLNLPKDAVPKFPKLSWLHLYRKEEEAPPPIVFGKDYKQ